MSEDILERKTIATYVALFGFGTVVEIAIAASTGVRESWDSEAFWSLGLPAMFAASFCAGMFGYGKHVMHGMVIVAGQFVAMMVRTGEIGTLVFLGVILSAILGAIISVGSIAGNAVKRFFDQ